jgi:hypothetical protein
MKIQVILLALLLSVTLYAHEEPSKTLYEKQQKEKTRKRIKDSGIIQSTAWKYTPVDGKLPEEGSKYLVQEYDENGNLSAVEAYKEDTLSLRVEYTFDKDHNMLTDTDLSPQGVVLEKNVFTYNPAGCVLSGEGFDGSGRVSGRFTIDLDAAGRALTFIKYRQHDSLDYRLVYSYAGHPDSSDYSEAAKYGADGMLLLQVKKIHDEKGNILEKTVMGPDQAVMHSFYYAYTPDGQFARITRKLAGGTPDWTDEYTYDQQGNCMEVKSYDAGNNLKTVIRYTYEHRGR